MRLSPEPLGSEEARASSSFNLVYAGGPLALRFLAKFLPNLKQSNSNAIYLTDIGEHGIPT